MARPVSPRRAADLTQSALCAAGEPGLCYRAGMQESILHDSQATEAEAMSGLLAGGPSHRAPLTRSAVARGRSDGFSHWREMVCRTYTRLSPERLGEAPFAGEIRMRGIADGASISRIAATAQWVHRRRADVAENPCDALFVNLQIEGRSVVRQRDSETRLTPGSFTVLDARRPFAMRFDGPFRQICLHLPFALFDGTAFEPASLLARRFETGSVFGTALREQVVALMAGQDGAEGSDHLVHLLRLACEGGRRPLLVDQHLALVQRHVVEQCGDPALSPQAVAGHFRISLRHLHKLFAPSGESFGRFLLRQRLERSLQAILAAPERSITEIALEAGFNDSSHFARSFRQRYGRSPRATRQGAASGGD
ncbi:MAG: helix-turn-helix domain-containing protein [Sneathiellaceae bacterium]